MADLRPIGSEKLQGSDKLSRIMEIANYGRTSKQEINESTGSVDYTIQLADGNFYGIVKEKNGYIVKKGINESEFDYIEPMKNRKYHSSYSQAMKKVNLMASELNRLHENDEGVNLIGEQKKFVLKTPKPEAPAEPEMEMGGDDTIDLDAAMGGDDTMDLDTPMGGDEKMDLDMDLGGDEEMDLDVDMSDDEGADEDEDISIKTIQKLTGKLGQKLRSLDAKQGMSSEDIKYVINSVLSAVDLTKLSEEDYDDVMENFEDMEDTDMEGGDEEMDLDMDLDMDLGGEEGEEELDMDLEMEPETTEMTELYNNNETMSGVERTMDEIFSESKVDKVLSKYFVITENEKKQVEEKQTRKYLVEKAKRTLIRKEIRRLCETVEQELTANTLIKESKNIKFLGKTNKNNLVFENKGKQIKISAKGEIL